METQSGEYESVKIFLNARNLDWRENKYKNFRIKCFVPPMDKKFPSENDLEFLGQTEVVTNDYNPIFSTPLESAFFFERVQPLEFQLFSTNNEGSAEEPAGSCSTVIGKLVGSLNQICSLDIKFNGLPVGKLIIKTVKSSKSAQKLMWQWGGLNLGKSGGLFCCSKQKNNPFLKFYAKEQGGIWRMFYKTETHRSNPTPVFESFDISLKGADFPEQEIKIDWCDDLVPEETQGSTILKLKEVLKESRKEFPLALHKASFSSPQHSLLLIQSTIFQEGTFLEFVFGGIQLQLIVGLDFTSDNRKNDNDLHSVSYDGTLNIYQQIIKLFCLILLNYDINQMVPLYGFGAKIRSEESDLVNPCFPLGWEPSSPGSRGVGGILHLYNKTVRLLDFAAPRLIVPIIEKFKDLAQDNQIVDIYSMALIIIAGDPEDFEASLELLASTNSIQLTIFFIGVGSSEFPKMKTLSTRLEKLRCKKGAERGCRNTVKFSFIEENGTDVEELVRIHLKKLERHVLEFMSSNNIAPKCAKDIDLKGFRI